MTQWTLILIAATANVCLNLCLRQTVRGLNTSSVGDIVIGLLISPWAWFSIACAGILLTAFMTAIRDYSMSLTYAAVTSIAMVALTLVSVALQIETVNTMRVLGLALIVSGIMVSAFA